MIQLESPQICVLSKIDIIEKFGPLPFPLEYFTEVLELQQLLDLLQVSLRLRMSESRSSIPTAFCRFVDVNREQTKDGHISFTLFVGESGA